MTESSTSRHWPDDERRVLAPIERELEADSGIEDALSAWTADRRRESLLRPSPTWVRAAPLVVLSAVPATILTLPVSVLAAFACFALSVPATDRVLRSAFRDGCGDPVSRCLRAASERLGVADSGPTHDTTQDRSPP